MSAVPQYRFFNKETKAEFQAPLEAAWEVAFDPISDDYTVDEISAKELFGVWRKKVDERYMNGVVPIHWYVESEIGGILERMPFEFDHEPDLNRPDFLTYFTWPVNVETSKPLNWVRWPVIDKLWRKGNAQKGGFIQEATGWKPSILQASLFLPSIVQGANLG